MSDSNNDIAKKKEMIRQEARLHRDRIDPRSESIDDAAELFFEAIKPDNDKVIAFYCPSEREFDVMPAIHMALEKNLICTLPVIQNDSRVLKFARFTEDTKMIPGQFNILEPEVNDNTEWLEPDIVIVPLLAFDRHGGRIGYGGGYYDATLAELRKKKDIIAVGMAYGQQAVLFNLPHEDHDQKLDWIITPLKAEVFS